MNKKIVLLICALCLMAIIGIAIFPYVSHLIKTDDWKTVELDNYGSFKIPEKWEASIVDGFMYISSAEGEYILIQYDKISLNSNDENISSNEVDYNYETNQFFDNFYEINTWIAKGGIIPSIGGAIGKYEIPCKDGSSVEMFSVVFPSPQYRDTCFICLDDSISEDTLKNIADSFDY